MTEASCFTILALEWSYLLPELVGAMVEAEKEELGGRWSWSKSAMHASEKMRGGAADK